VQGIEPDPEAARVATYDRTLPVVVGRLESAHLPPGSFDAITLHHVIEHTQDPLATLKECRGLLKEGGRLVVVTPCVEALGHRVFGRS
jgi:2-polyprenyl-3-methyl-5-hydroxy-6-metoxy-1,4-benzoquinol methylase